MKIWPSGSFLLVFLILIFGSSICRAESSVVVWGDNTWNQTNKPPGLTNIVAISAGLYHTLALRNDGTVAAWGDNGKGQINVPANLSNVVSVAGGLFFSVALRSNGTVTAWGSYHSNGSYFPITPPSNLSNVVAISAHDAYALALKADGTVVAWGDNYYGQRNLPAGLSNVVAIAAGGFHGLALRGDGSVVAWGTNLTGTFSAPYVAASVPVSATNVIAIGAGASHSLALRSDGSVIVWGDNKYGQLNAPSGLTNVTQIAVGWGHNLVLKATGTLAIWGTHWPASFFRPPYVPTGLSNVVGLAAGSGHDVVLQGDGPPFLTSALSDWTAVYGSTAQFRISATGSLPLTYQWRLNGVDLADQTNATLSVTNIQMEQAGLYSVVVSNAFGIATSRQANLGVVPLIITEQSKSQTAFLGSSVTNRVAASSMLPLFYQWRLNGAPLPGSTTDTLLLTNIQLSQAGVYDVVVSNSVGALTSVPTSLVIRQVVAWGIATNGQTNAPASLTNAIAIAAGSDHALALRTDRTVVAWGLNTYGQANIPSGLIDVIAIAAGDFHNVALKNNGTVVAWGRNGNGETNVPGSVTNVFAIACGPAHSLALKDDGTVVAWGSNFYGQTNVPTDLSNVVAIAAGSAFSVALKGDGRMVAWGYSAATNVPVEFTNVVAVAPRGSVGLALTSDFLVKDWPPGVRNQETEVPAGLSNVIAIASGSSHSLALKSDGKVIAWGAYMYGRPVILNPRTPASDTPAGLGNVVSVSGGSNYSVALIGDGPPVIAPFLPMRYATHGRTAYLRVEAVGTFPLSYQWKFNGEELPRATNSVLEVTNISLESAGIYTVVVSNALGSADAETILAVIPIAFTSQPIGQTTFKGASALFTATAASPSPINFQWRFNGTDLAGETNSSLLLTNLQFANSGNYSVLASNELGIATSSIARLNVISVALWGRAASGITNLPGDLTNVVALAGANAFAMALRENGSVTAWGNDTSGMTSVPANVTNAVAIAANNYSCLALRSNGTVVAWGNNANGQSSVPVDLSNVVAIASGYQHSVALKSDGRVTAWGISSAVTNLPAGLDNVIGIAAGSSYSLALRGDGSVVAWGNNSGATNVPSTLRDVVEIGAGGSHALALLSDGTVSSWGNNSVGQTNVPAGLDNVVAIACGSAHSMAMKSDGSLVVWGSNSYGQTNVPAVLHNVSTIAAGSEHSSALVGEGRPFLRRTLIGRTVVYGAKASLFVSASGAGPLSYQWRLNGTNLVGATNAILTLNSAQFGDAGAYSVLVSNAEGSIASAEAMLSVVPLKIVDQPRGKSTFRGDDVRLEVTMDGQDPFDYQWQRNGVDLPEATDRVLILNNAQPAESGEYSVSIQNSVGSITSSVVMVSIGDVAVWGDSYFDGFYGYTRMPAGLTNIIAVAGGANHSIALKRDGTVVAWGDNRDGQTNTPPGLSNIVAIAAGYRHNLGLLADGTVVAWPSNIYSAPPIGLSNVVAIAAGNDCSAALKADGTVVSWGINHVGQTNLPPNLTNVVALAARHYSSLALTRDGRIVGWGWNNYGQTDAPPLTDAIGVGVGPFYSAAVRANGSVVVWGDTRIVTSPANLLDAVAVSGGDNHAIALKRDGTVFVWGNQEAVPDRLRNVVSISAGLHHNLALIGDEPLPPNPPLSNSTWSADGFAVQAPTRSGKVYGLEYKESVAMPGWIPFPLKSGTGERHMFLDPTATNSQRFYRVQEW